MTGNIVHKKLTVLHVATLCQPITSELGYAPIETIIYNNVDTHGLMPVALKI